MRVLFWIRRRTALPGGDLVALENTIAALQRLKVECDISDDPARDLAPYTLVHLYNLADPTVAVEYVARAHDAQKPLVVTPIYWSHAHWLETRAQATSPTHPEFFLGALDAATRALSENVLQQQEQLARAVHQLVCAAAARIFLLSDAEGEQLAREFCAAPEKFRRAPMGADPQFANGDAARFTENFHLRDFVLSAARIEERKNTIGVIRAWRDETIPLAFAGNAPDAGYLELCKREAGANVHFLGSLTPSQLADAYAAARVHILASWWEEASIAALEAGMAGCNLVLSENSSAREYFGDGCWICNPAEPDSIHAALRAAYDAPRQENLPRHLREHFTWERTAHVLRDAYAEISAAPNRFLFSADAGAWQNVGATLAALLHLRETYLQKLEAQTRAQAEWTRELENIVAARNAERERLVNLPFAKYARKIFSA